MLSSQIHNYTALSKGDTVDAGCFVQFLKHAVQLFSNLKLSRTILEGLATVKHEVPSFSIVIWSCVTGFISPNFKNTVECNIIATLMSWKLANRVFRQLPKPLLLRELETLQNHRKEVARQSCFSKTLWCVLPYWLKSIPVIVWNYFWSTPGVFWSTTTKIHVQLL